MHREFESIGTERVTRRGFTLLRGESLLMLAFFLTVILTNQISSGMTGAGYYFILIVSLLYGGLCLLKNVKLVWISIIFSTGMIGLGVLNHLVSGNIAVLRIFLCVCGLFWALVMIQQDLDERIALVAYGMNVAIVVFRFAVNGLYEPVYLYSSNNYISIYLLAPLVMYYIQSERHKVKIRLIPGIVALAISFVAGSRGGFLTCAILFTGIVVYRYFAGARNKAAKVALFAVLFVIGFLVVISFLPRFVEKFSDLRVVSRFTQIGMEGSGREEAWEEYFSAVRSPKGFVFGARLEGLYYMRQYNNNLHNSFLFIHAYFGIVGFLAVLGILAYDSLWGIRNGKWIYLLCLFVYLLRGLTDHLFGAHRLSPVFLFVLLYPVVLKRIRKKTLLEQ